MRPRKSFRNDRSGNFALYTAIAILPILGAAGLSVDYYALSEDQKSLQSAIDAAVLAVAAEGDKLDDAQAGQVARQYVESNFGAVENLALKREGEQRFPPRSIPG